MKVRFLIVSLLIAGTAFAHEGVKNPAVMARMNGMSSIGEHTKVLGQMAKGAAAFDAQTAQQAASKLALEAARIEALFKARESDPKSETLPEVWTQFPDFVAKAQDLEALAKRASMAQSQADLQVAMREIGATCSACHKVYRKP